MAKDALKDEASSEGAAHPVTLHHDDEYHAEMGDGPSSAHTRTRARFRAVLNVTNTVSSEGASHDGNKRHGWKPNIPMGRGGRVSEKLSNMSSQVQQTQGSLLARSHACDIEAHIPVANPGRNKAGEGTSLDVGSVLNATRKVRMWSKFTPGMHHKTREADKRPKASAKSSPAVPSISVGAVPSISVGTAEGTDAGDAHASLSDGGDTKVTTSGSMLSVSTKEAPRAKSAGRGGRWAKGKNRRDSLVGSLKKITAEKKVTTSFWAKSNKVEPRAHIGWNTAKKRFNKDDHDGGINGQSFVASPGGSRMAPTDIDDEWNDSYDDPHEGERARRLQTRFDSRNDLGIVGFWLNSVSRWWGRQKEKMGIEGDYKLGNAGVGFLFRDTIKEIGAEFGGGMSAFFKFIKFLVVANFWMFALELCFVVIPGFVSWPEVKSRQIVHANLTCSLFNDTEAGRFLPAHVDLNNVSTFVNSSFMFELAAHWKERTTAGNYTGLESPFEPIPNAFEPSNYLDGRGIMGYSPIFYGGYVAELKSGYRTDVAYILTFLVCSMGLLFNVMGRAFRKDRSVGSIIFKASPTAPFSTGIFSTWDYAMTSVNAREALRQGIYTSLIDGCEETLLEKEELRLKKKKEKAKDAAEKDKMKIEMMRRKKSMSTLADTIRSVKHIVHTESLLMKKGYHHPRSDELALMVESLKIEQMVDEAEKQERRSGTKIYLRRALGWFTWAVVLAGTFTGIGFMMKSFIAAKTEARETGTELTIVNEFMLSGTLAFANVALPAIFQFVASFEKYKEGDELTTILVTRMFIMRIGTIYAICMALYVELKLNQLHQPTVHQKLWGVQQDCCAGTILGQEAYKLVVTDIFATNLAEIGTATLLAKILKRKLPEEQQKVEMDVAQALIYLCYRQGLIWIGMLFAPPLAFVGLLGSIFSFYVYFYLAFWAYTTPTALSSRVSSEIFTKALALTLLLTSPLLILITRVWSPNCGPMAGYSTILSGLEVWSRDSTFDAGGAEIILSESSPILIMVTDPAVLYAIVFVLGFVITVMAGRIAARQEECILQANALDIAHSELDGKKNEIFYDHFVAASRMIRNRLNQDGLQIEKRRMTGRMGQTKLNPEDIDLLDVVHGCLTFDGMNMLQTSPADSILPSQDAEWLRRFLTASLRSREAMADVWVRNPDGSRNNIYLAVYPKDYTSPSDWHGLFDQIYKQHKAVWTYAQNVFQQMVDAPFADLEKEAKRTFLHGYTFAQAFVMGDSIRSTDELLKAKKEPVFMTTERLIHLAEKEEERISKLTEAEMEKDETLDDFITPSQLRAWLYFNLNIDETFGPNLDNEYLISNCSVDTFGDCYACYEVTDFLDPDLTSKA